MSASYNVVLEVYDITIGFGLYYITTLQCLRVALKTQQFGTHKYLSGKTVECKIKIYRNDASMRGYNREGVNLLDGI